jgi:uncharacterized protein YjbJ (UPF0337 family)
MTESLSGDYAGQARTTDSPSTADSVSAAAGSVAGTAKDQAGRVTDEVRAQTKGVAHQARERLVQETRTQHDRLADGLRTMSQELDRMAGDRPDSPARSIVDRIARSGEQAADYLSKHGPDEVLAEVQDFARRRPGAFLATALVSGFVVGRVGKSIFTADSGPGNHTSTSDMRNADTYPLPRQPMADPDATVVLPAEPAATWRPEERFDDRL